MIGPRQLPEVIGKAFHSACDEGDLVTARDLLRVMESLLGRTPTPTPKRVRDFVSACERLWELTKDLP